MQRFSLTVLLILLFFKQSSAVVPVLEREVNLHIQRLALPVVLDKIKEQTGAVFSYQPAILAVSGPITLAAHKKTIREVLSLILPKTVVFKSRNNYIILKERNPDRQDKTTLSGYVYDKKTDAKVAHVTIYDKNTLQSATTNEYGYYTIVLPKDYKCLTINKENYRDTCITLQPATESPITNIVIDPMLDTLAKADSIAWKKKLHSFSEHTNNLFKRFKGYINTFNVKDTLTKNFQLSLLPFVGTNAALSANVYNNYSVNVIGGYARGSRTLEMGGLFNIDKENVKNAQLAGLFNVVGDSVNGAQLAGLANLTGECMKGFQAAGFLNMNLGNTRGFQAAGAMNINAKNLKGVSAAGLLNLNRLSMTGTLLAGGINLTIDTLRGAALAGLLNISGHDQRSVTIAGLINAAGQGQANAQLGGILNYTAKGTTRLQVAGLVNRANILTGLQIGLLNFADSSNGIPIGLFSFVKKGMHQIELSSDELFYASLTAKTGVKTFHTLITAGIQPSPTRMLWHIGYGVGTCFPLKNKLGGDISATYHHVSVGDFNFGTSELGRFYAGLNYRFSGKFSIAAGPTFNVFWSDTLALNYASTYSKIAPYTLSDLTTSDSFNFKSWVGARVSLRFL